MKMRPTNRKWWWMCEFFEMRKMRECRVKAWVTDGVLFIAFDKGTKSPKFSTPKVWEWDYLSQVHQKFQSKVAHHSNQFTFTPTNYSLLPANSINLPLFYVFHFMCFGFFPRAYSLICILVEKWIIKPGKVMI